MSKKGVSDVITTVLMILIVLAAIGIVWAVVSSFLNNSTEQIDLGAGFSQIDIVDNSVKYLPSDVLELKVKRDSNPGNISGLRIIVESVEGNTQSYDIETSVKELETKTIDVQLQGKIQNISKVSIAPRTPIKNKIKTGSTADEQRLSKSVVDLKGDSSTIAYIPLNEGSGLIAKDLISGINGSIQTNVKWTNDVNFSHGLIFRNIGYPPPNYNNDYVLFPGNSLFDITTNGFSAGFWIKYDTYTNIAVPFQNGNGNDLASGYRFAFSNPGNIYFRISDGTNRRTTSQYLLQNGNTYFVVGVVDRTNNKVRIYINGNEYGNAVDITGVGSLVSPSELFYVGSNAYAGINGSMKDVFIVNRTLSAQEVYYLYKYG